MRTVIGNCLLYALYHRFFTRDSTLHYYYNKRCGTLSFYVVVDNQYKISFTRVRNKPVYIKNVLFYVRPKITWL